MTTPKHTPTPWRIDLRTKEWGGEPSYAVFGPANNSISLFDDTTYYPTAPSEANAKFIVHAVNLHDDLVKALGDMTRRLTGLTFAMSDPDYEAIEKATALLHRAKEGQ